MTFVAVSLVALFLVLALVLTLRRPRRVRTPRAVDIDRTECGPVGDLVRCTLTDTAGQTWGFHFDARQAHAFSSDLLRASALARRPAANTRRASADDDDASELRPAQDGPLRGGPFSS